MEVQVVKRDGRREEVMFDEIMARVRALCYNLSPRLDKVDTVRIVQKVILGIRDGVTTSELDELTAHTAVALSSYHPEYSELAARVAISNLHKETTASISSVFNFLDPLIVKFAQENIDEIDAAFVWGRDYLYDYFGYKTLEKSYLHRDSVSDKVIERPQVMLMRIALGIHCAKPETASLEDALVTYSLMSKKVFTHATPTMFNAGTSHPHMASCFLLSVPEDSIEGIFYNLQQCALISKSAGGIGFSVSNIRASGSRIASTNGKSAGLLPFLRIYDATARAVDQGGGKRKGAFAAYLEPWHPDIRTFLDMKKNHGVEELRARDLFYALWIPDLFMKRVDTGATWSLFCPSKCPDLVDLYGEAFETRYCEYEAMEGLTIATVPAQEIWFAILDAQIETGTPYMLYKDACNMKSNHKHLGTIRCSNLCTEIVQYQDGKDEIAVCNLASISLPSCMLVSDNEEPMFDHYQLASAVRVVTHNLNKVIDNNAYPLEQTKHSNLRHRPLGIGVQGLADVFTMLNLPFDSRKAQQLNREIFETIYYAALDASCAIATNKGAPYPSYEGSPMSQGKLQMDLWAEREGAVHLTQRWNWDDLRTRIAKHGVYNSLLVAPMPTASTAQILGNTECFEPVTSNIYSRRVLAGEFVVINKHLVKRLESVGLWTDEVRTAIIQANGSVQGVEAIPEDLKALFKTAWEIKMRTLIDLSVDRGPFVDQSQSLNLFMEAPDYGKLTSAHMYGWRKGLKTGMYYLRTRPAADAVKVTVPVKEKESPSVCRRDDPDCIACSA